MSPFLLILTVLLSISLVACALGFRTAWKNRAKPSAKPLLALFFSVAFWSLCYIMEANSTDLQSKIFWATIKYPLVVIVPVSLSVFLMRFAGWTNWPGPRLLAVMLIVPSLSAAAALTNANYHLFWTSNQLQTFPDYTSLNSTRGPVFNIYAIYSYALILVSATAAAYSLSPSWRLYRRQILWLAIGICLPIAANLLSISGAHPWPGIDLSPAAFGLGALFLLSFSGLTGVLNVTPLAYHTLMKQMRDGVLVLDTENRVREINPAAERILGLTYSKLVGKDFLSIAHPAVDVVRLSFSGSISQHDMQMNIGEKLNWYDMRMSEVRTSSGEMAGRLIIWHNITERKNMENKLRFSSTHDTLTGLYNRMYFDMDMERVRFGRSWPVTVVMMDLDFLKHTNDTFGHSVGDELIRQSAELLHTVFRKEDMLARIGGDEFAALLPDCDDHSASLLVRRLYEAQDKHNENEPTSPVSFSVGYAVAEAGDNLAKTMIKADANLYAEKSRRKQPVKP